MSHDDAVVSCSCVSVGVGRIDLPVLVICLRPLLLKLFELLVYPLLQWLQHPNLVIDSLGHALEHLLLGLFDL